MEKNPAPYEYCIGPLLLGEMKSERDYITAKINEAGGRMRRYYVVFASLAPTTSCNDPFPLWLS